MAPAVVPSGGPTMVRRAAIVLVTALMACLAVPSLASAALSWSGPVNRDRSGTGPALNAVSCPTASLCVSLDSAGGEVSFDPASPGPQNPVSVDSATPLAMTCPSASQCIAVDTAGGEVTFDPAHPRSTHSDTIDSGHILTGITCLAGSSPQQCVAVDNLGQELTFDPASPQGVKVKTIDAPSSSGKPAPQILTAVSCLVSTTTTNNTPTTTTTCVAVDTSGNQVTFDPTKQTASSPGAIDFDQGALTAVICLASSSGGSSSSPSISCLAFDSKGEEITFSPSGSSSSSISSYSLEQQQGNGIVAADCPTSSQCVALDSAGNELSFAPSAQQQPPLVHIDPSKGLTALACSAAQSCTAVNARGQGFRFAPGATTAPSPVLLDALPSYSGVTCVSASQCTATDESGDEVTFDPQTRAPVSALAVDPNAGFIYSVACPSATQCTTGDINGRETTFNPQSPAGFTSAQEVNHHPIMALACPSATQCTGVDDNEYEVTFNPQSPGSPSYGNLGTPQDVSLTGLACPSATQCTAVDASGQAVTFDPGSVGSPKPVKVLSDPAVAVSCPSVSECVAVDSAGHRATFDPHKPAGASRSAVDSQHPLGLQCLTTTYCVILDAAGRSVEFDPQGAGATAAQATGSGSSARALGCAAPATCVSVGSDGLAFAGTGQLPPRPVGTESPQLSGTPRVGAILTGSTGSWTNHPTAFNARWERCGSGGSDCRDIPGATGQSYTLTAADTGHTLRLREAAANQSGWGGPVASSPTPAIASSTPNVRAVLSRPGAADPRLRVAIQAARYGPELHVLQVELPHGLAFTPQGSGGGYSLSVTSHGHPVSATVRRSGGHLVVGLAGHLSSLKLLLHAPSLRVASWVARDRSSRLWLGLLLPASPNSVKTRSLVAVDQ